MKVRRVLVLGLLLICLVTPNFASAYGANIFSGGGANISNASVQAVQGARATITTPSAYPTVVSGQATSVWVAVANYNTAAIAQVGFALEPTQLSKNPHYFYGSKAAGGSYSEIIGSSGPPLSMGLSYEIKKESGYWKGYENNNLVGSVAITVSPNNVQYYNETYADAPRWVGFYGDALKFSSVQYWDGSASSTDTTKWVWKKPSGMNFDSMASIDYSNWTSSSYWTSWN